MDSLFGEIRVGRSCTDNFGLTSLSISPTTRRRRRYLTHSFNLTSDNFIWHNFAVDASDIPMLHDSPGIGCSPRIAANREPIKRKFHVRSGPIPRGFSTFFAREIAKTHARVSTFLRGRNTPQRKRSFSARGKMRGASRSFLRVLPA